jgi:hypothetical protein
MALSGFVLALTRLVAGAVATFLAILVWSKTREAAWVLVVAGALAMYAGTVYAALELFGIVGDETLVVAGIPVGALIIQNLPTLLFIAAFAVFLLRRRV